MRAGIREECLSFRKLLDSEIITHYFQIFKARNKDKADPATYFVKAQYKSVEKPYAEATKTHRRGGVGAGRRPTRLIERLAERWEQNIYLEEEAHREHAAPSADIQIRNRFDPRKESKCDAYREPYAKSFALIALPGTGTDEFYFYKVRPPRNSCVLIIIIEVQDHEPNRTAVLFFWPGLAGGESV
jgi:hypothetical protein